MHTTCTHKPPTPQLSTKWRQHLAQAKALLHQYDALPEHQRPPLETQIHTQVAAADQLTMLMGLFTPTYLSLLTIGVGCEEELEARGDPVEWSRQLLVCMCVGLGIVFILYTCM